MSAAAGGGSEDRKKIIAVTAFLIVAAGVLYYELHDAFGSSAPTPVVASAPAAPVSSGTVATPNAQQTAADLVAPRDLADVCFRIGAFCNDPRLFIVAPEPSATAARDDFDTPVRGAFIPVLMHEL